MRISWSVEKTEWEIVTELGRLGHGVKTPISQQHRPIGLMLNPCGPLAYVTIGRLRSQAAKNEPR
jgi:hypothetical protein